jgi:glutamine synthetase
MTHANFSSSDVSSNFEILPIRTYNELSDSEILKAYNLALLRTLNLAGIQFLRIVAVDSSNTLRSKAIPLSHLLKSASLSSVSSYKSSVSSSERKQQQRSNEDFFGLHVSIAKACFGALPSYADCILPGTTVDARYVYVLRPDMNTLRRIPYAPKTAIAMASGLYDSISQRLSPLCTRTLLGRVLHSATKVQGGIFLQVGAELEFVLVHDQGRINGDDISKEISLPTTLPQPVDTSLFASTTTLNQQQDFINDLCQQLEDQYIDVELVHAESAPGQLEVVLAYQKNVMMLADNVVLARETIRCVARNHKLRAIFLPKIHPQYAGNGLHLHFSFTQGKESGPAAENSFTDWNANQTCFPSPIGQSFMEGILQHLPALLALTMPTTNSFRRVGPGCWTGSTVCWNFEDKESPLRICMDVHSGKASNLEYKLADSTANIHLALAAIISAGLQGIVLQAVLRPPGVSSEALPTTLGESLQCLREDSFLQSILGHDLWTNYLALRWAECSHTASMSLENEVIQAYNAA